MFTFNYNEIISRLSIILPFLLLEERLQFIITLLVMVVSTSIDVKLLGSNLQVIKNFMLTDLVKRVKFQCYALRIS